MSWDTVGIALTRARIREISRKLGLFSRNPYQGHLVAFFYDRLVEEEETLTRLLEGESYLGVLEGRRVTEGPWEDSD